MVQGAEAQALIGGLHSPTSSGRLSLSFLRSPVSLHFGPQSSCNFQTLAPPPTPSRWLLLAAQVEEERGQMAGGSADPTGSRAAGGLAETLREPPDSALVCAWGLVEDELREAGKIPTLACCSLHVANAWDHLCRRAHRPFIEECKAVLIITTTCMCVMLGSLRRAGMLRPQTLLSSCNPDTCA